MKKTKRGFTIVELVIVIAVIAILAAILIPVFSNVTSKAQETARASEIKNAHSAFVADQALVNGSYAELYDYLYHDGEKYYSWDETNEKWVEATKGTETKQNTNSYGGWDLYM